MKELTVLFSCEKCGLQDVECKVRARAKEEDVAQWFEGVVIAAIARKHTTLSLLCEAKKITYIKIPIDHNDPDGWVGKHTDIVQPKGRP